MNFTSIAFYCLFIITIIGLFFCQRLDSTKKLKFETILLSLLSIIYTGWQDWRFALLIIIESVIVFYVTKKIDVSKSKKWLFLGISTIIFFLAIFKYLNFFIDTITWFGVSLKRVELILPLGISFYSFSAIGYMTDVYRKKYSSEKDFLNVLLYMSFFPKLTAGPIISADEFFKQLKDKKRKISLNRISSGLQIIVFGLVKKNVLADNIAVFVDAVYNNVAMYNWQTLTLAIFAYGIQIYLDFSGYSDMAVGCAKCLGFNMPINFNLPYLSRNITELWKRWHITLSNWLMRYLYIGLGGNRKGYIRTLMNLILTMVIGGLWHGSSWNFVLWGLLHGIALCIHKEYMRIFHIDKKSIPSPAIFICNVILTYLYTNFCWIFFRITDLHTIKLLLTRILTKQNGVAFYSSWTIISIISVTVATIIATVYNFKKEDGTKRYGTINGFYIKRPLSSFWNLVLFFLACGVVLAFAYANSNPFIYANF